MSENKNDLNEALNKYKQTNLSLTNPENKAIASTANIPTASTYDPSSFQSKMSQETDLDLTVGYEIIKLPSDGIFYKHGMNEVKVEYMTAKDEDVLTTPSLIENGTVLDVVLRRKIKTQGIIIDDLLPGDKSALLLFLRSSAYG